MQTVGPFGHLVQIRLCRAPANRPTYSAMATISSAAARLFTKRVDDLTAPGAGAETILGEDRLIMHRTRLVAGGAVELGAGHRRHAVCAKATRPPSTDLQSLHNLTQARPKALRAWR